MKTQGCFRAVKLPAFAFSFAALAVAMLCGIAQAQIVVTPYEYYASGLIQAKFNAGNWAAAYSPDILSNPTAERVPGAVMADTEANENNFSTAGYLNPITGNAWYWNKQYTGWGYIGEMRVENGVTYTFGKSFDDNARIIIDNVQVLNDESAGNWTVRTYTATNTAWVSFEVRLYDGTGGKGPRANWAPDLGLAFNTTNHTAMLPKTAWTKLLDPGDQSLFRTKMYAPTADAPAFDIPPEPSFDGTDFRLSAVLAHGVADLFALAGFGGEYDITNRIAAAAVAGVPESGAFTNLAANTMYTSAVLADNGIDDAAFIASATPFFTGELTLEHNRDAEEEGFVQGIVTVRRANTPDAKRLPLAVNYSFTGAGLNPAAEGVNYAAPSGVVTIPAGADSAQIFIVPLIDVASSGGTTLNVTLDAGLYYRDATPVPVFIEKWISDPTFNTWIAPAAGNASVAANWSYNVVPSANDDILLGSFSTADMTWDADGVNGLPDTVASWTQEPGYTGAVTFKTTYTNSALNIGFTNFTVSGDAEIFGGSWTHNANSAAEDYRLRVSVGGDFTLGDGAVVNLQYKGYAPSKFPAGGATGIHGGARGNGGNFGQVYGDVYEPVNIGAGGASSTSHYGGGALYLTVGGTALINGVIRSDSFFSGLWNTSQGGAGGSVYIRAGAIEGGATGSIYARGNPQNSYASSGGRIALIATGAQNIGYALAKVHAQGNGSGFTGGGAGAGTVFLKHAGQTHGSLLVDNVHDGFTNNEYAPHTSEGTTCVPPGETWTFDEIIIRNRGILSVPPTARLVLPGGFASVRSADTLRTGGIMYLGGDIVLGGPNPYTFQNNWIFAAVEPYVINDDVHVVNNGILGIMTLRNTLDKFHKFDLTVNGNLTVDASGAILAKYAGVDYDANRTTQISAHGGQIYATPANRPTDPLASRVYGSVLNPVHPGMWGSDQLRELRRDFHVPGGGVILLRVNGNLHLDGVADASAYDFNHDHAGSAGGSVNIIATTLTGSGKIDSSGYQTSGNNNKFVAGPGRVAVRLTGPGADFSAFGESNIMARGCSGTATAQSANMTSAGTVYLETAADGEGAGKVIIWNNNEPRNNLAFTPFPSFDYGGDQDDFRNVSLDIGQCARVKLFDSVRVKEAVTRAGTDLDLNGFTLTLDNLALGDRKVMNSGVFSAAQLITRGYSGISDSDPNAAGLVKIIPASTIIILR